VLVIVILLQVLSNAAIGNYGLKMLIHELIEVPLSKELGCRSYISHSIFYHLAKLNYNVNGPFSAALSLLM